VPEHLFDRFNLPEWGILYFIRGEDDSCEEGGDETNSIRREVWFVAGDAYLYQFRKDPSDDWSEVWISDCGPEVEIDGYGIVALGAIVSKYFKDQIVDGSANIHPVLRPHIVFGGA